MTANNQNLISVPPGMGKMFLVLNDLYVFKVEAQHTGGAFSLIEGTIRPQGGPPLHRHPQQETFYILEGEFTFFRQNGPFQATVGSVIHVPSGVPHTFKNVGATPGKFLVLIQPAGFEKFFEEIGEPIKDLLAVPSLANPTPEDQQMVEKRMVLAPKYNLELLGSPPE